MFLKSTQKGMDMSLVDRIGIDFFEPLLMSREPGATIAKLLRMVCTGTV